MNGYATEFEAALKRAKSFGLSVPEVQYEEGQCLDRERLQRLILGVKGIFKALSLEEIQTQSLMIHRELRPIVEKAFESPVFYTIGSVHLPPKDYFVLTDAAISSLLKEGPKDKGLDLHAWLTFPTMEIIDFSINTTLAAVLNSPEIAGRILAAHPTQFKGGLAFRPVLVGEDLLNRLGGAVK